MKTFARKFLLTPYMKYGNSFIFNAIVPLSCIASSIIGGCYPYSIEFKLSILLSIILFFIVISITIAGNLMYEWKDLSDYQKLKWGKDINHELNLLETCEWVRLYGNKITKNEIDSKLQNSKK